MTRYRHIRIELALTALAAIFLLCCVEPAFAQKERDGGSSSRDLVGSIDLQTTDIKKTSYSDIQNNTISYFKDIENKLTAPQSIGRQKDLNGRMMKYLAAAYLYCTLKSGACPLVLDGVLEVDLINSKLNNKAACPNMKQFWKAWIGNDMERRLEYRLNIGFLAKTQSFKKHDRPKYLRCEDTLAKLTSGTIPNSEFFSRRYASDSPHTNTIKQLRIFLDTIKKRVPNLFAATGTNR
ncbi:hypothetical protein OAO01_09470 [Oligoflexia bacterium]|nr:hypothetical protein [Oligoflexia bacterium]